MKVENKIKLALVGSDSLRGKEIKDVLNTQRLFFDSIDFFDPDVKQEYTKLTEFRGEAKVIQNLDGNSLLDSDLVFLAADQETNRKFGFLARSQDFQVIDLAGTFNADEEIPVVVAGINDKYILKERPEIVANPHPATIILSHILDAILLKFHLEKAVSFVLQPVSAFEESGIEELANQSFAILNGSALTKKVFRAQIAFNLLSHTESLDKDGFDKVEKQVMAEVRRVLGVENLPLTLSIIQAPVFHTYSIMIYFELKRKASLQALKDVFKRSPYVKLSSPNLSSPASCVSVAGKDKIYIGQIKKVNTLPNSFWLWAVADNLTRGSALNAFEIAEQISSARKA